MTNNLIAISKFLSLVLRHKPDSIDLTLDTEGWANIQELISSAQKKGLTLNESLIYQVVQKNDKQRFTLSENKKYIRARHGHSIDINLGLKSTEPPELLYHGTASHFLPSIKKIGLVPKQRKYVHLSTTAQTADLVGQRHGVPIVLTIKAKEMYTKGFEFFVSESQIWLTKIVPPEFITFPNQYKSNQL